MERRKNCCSDVLPFSAMVAMEFATVGLNTLFKAATLKGMSYHVYIAALLLLPSLFFFLRCTSQTLGYTGINCRSPTLASAISSLVPAFTFILALLVRSRVLPPLSFSISCKIFLLGLIGCTSQIMGYAGINYSSPALDSAMSSLIPGFTFILALLFRMEKLAIRSSSSQAKIIGTMVSIAGAFVVTLYKGPAIPFSPPPSPSLDHPLRSPQSNWVIGGLFLTIEFILVPMWYILQAKIMKEYPAELTVVFFYNLYVSVLAAIVGIFTEPNTSAWIIKADIGLVSILCSGIFGSFLDNAVITWVLKVRGPVYVAMFKPLSIIIAVVMGIAFLGDTLYLGSIIGATIISVGFYTVMWGKANEDVDEIGEIGDPESVSNPKVPLLQSYLTQETQS